MSDAQIAELETLRRQLQQLHELFAVVIGETRPTPDNPGIVPWPELLSKFNVLASKYEVLSRTVGQKSATLLKEMAVVPQTRPSGIHEQNIMAVLLRTKLAPEIEKEEEAIWAQIEAGAQQDTSHESLAIAAMDAFRSLRKGHDGRVQAMLADALPQEAAQAPAAVQVSLEDVLAFVSSGRRA
ncbi:hypothetical protein LPJ61_000236 [Coemansia biformis]|uniref:Mediator of RNA polymerase II transcription subunit 8 n=1 Tax=Coemansia biformis TaxID=1286918 RepID=A0A9W8CZ83_9FUNG|nr:hypothetical protein LPJ61_000236 [Coemansia biformis]